MVEHNFEEQHRQEAHDQGQARSHDVGELDPGSCPCKLMVDELLVIEQLAIRLRLRPESHDASSLRGNGLPLGSIRPLYTQSEVEKYEESQTHHFYWVFRVRRTLVQPDCACERRTALSGRQ